jgi:hypothetical protein
MITAIELSRRLEDSLLADDIGLYEAFWEVDEGQVKDPEQSLSKAFPWKDVSDLVLALIGTGKAKLVYYSNGIAVSAPEDYSSIVSRKANWKPFDMNRGHGYALRWNSQRQ